jgi:hypothetical protein
VASFVKFQSFVEKMAEGVHNLGADALTVGMTTNANAPVNTDDVLVDLTEIGYGSCSSRVISVASSAETGGVYKLTCTDLVLTSSGTVGPFQWVFIYNDTPANNDLICYFDYGSEITLANTETLTLDFDGANGLLQVT